MKYKQFTLDPFQVEAIHALERNHSVVVSAATGTGKTLVADYVITKYIKEGKRIIYTAPIKALSNQKFRDFTKDFGEDTVGLITGDVQINQGGRILIMTTEIYRNMLLSHDPIVDEVAYVIFDEIHFIADRERGTIWEESIIFSPQHMRFLCLSATIPNAQQFADWIQSIHTHKVEVVQYGERAVPLTHYYYDEEGFGLMDRKQLEQAQNVSRAPRYDRGKRKRQRTQQQAHISLIKELKEKDWLPCLFFIFSRMLCLKKAKSLARVMQFLPQNKHKRVLEIFRKVVTGDQAQLESARVIKELALKGIGVHHAGLLPKVKEFIELCFSEGLLSVLFATETFAVGINMPARAVCFLSLLKFDGINFRLLNTKEYFQLAGRAGRRGIDKEGQAISMFEMSKADIPYILKITKADVDPLKSQFGLSYNTALYLFHQYGIKEAGTVLKKSFYHYQRKSKGESLRISASYKNRLKALEKLGYITKHGLTSRGEVLLHIYSHELLLGEIFTTPIVHELEPLEIILFLAAIEIEERRGVNFRIDHSNPYPRRILKKIASSDYAQKNIKKFNLKRLAAFVTTWVKDGDFPFLTELSSMQEGDIIHLFRRVMDSLRQLRHAVRETELKMKFEECIKLIDKPPVKFEL